MADDRLREVPKEEALFCVAPPFAKHYGILPLKLTMDGSVLHVCANRTYSQSDLDSLVRDFRKKIVVDYKVSDADFDEAFNRFYADLLGR